MMHIETRELPFTLRTALERTGYRCRDIKVAAAESAVLNEMGSAGQRAFVCLVNLATGQTKVTRGSWGGPNMFSPRNAVDNDGRTYPIPTNGAVIQGSQGGKVYARIVVHPTAFAKLLPDGEDKVSEKDASILNIFTGMKGGPYRREELRRMKATDEEINSLVERGYLKRNKAGAIQATTKGKNAASGRPI